MLKPARHHTPLLPLYKSIDETHLIPGVVVWNQDRALESCHNCFEHQDIGIRSRDTPGKLARRQQSRFSRQQEPCIRQTCIRTRFRVSVVRQQLFVGDHQSTPKTTISLSGNFCLETSSSVFLRPPPRRSRLWSRRYSFLDSQTFCLAMYFFFNLSLTLLNKMVLMQFPFPYTLTALHALCGAVGGYLLLQGGVFVSSSLDLGQNLALVIFSILYAVNIIVSNLSLQQVTIPFHQVVRAATPFFTILFTTFILGIRSSHARIMSLIPVIAGVGLATYGDYDFTACGFFLTLLGTILAAVKTILTNVFQSSWGSSESAICKFFSGMSLSSLDLLYRMSPLAFIYCMLFAQASGELQMVRQYVEQQMTLSMALALALNGALAFGLNVVSFMANKKAGALSMTVAANVKQVLTILLAIGVFDLTVTLTNGLGIAVTILGGVWYAMVEYHEKKMIGTSS